MNLANYGIIPSNSYFNNNNNRNRQFFFSLKS